MTKWLALGGLAVLVLALARVLAVGRKAQPTLTEAKRAAWAGLPKAYAYTQKASSWKLRLTRGAKRRKAS